MAIRMAATDRLNGSCLCPSAYLRAPWLRLQSAICRGFGMPHSLEVADNGMNGVLRISTASSKRSGGSPVRTGCSTSGLVQAIVVKP